MCIVATVEFFARLPFASMGTASINAGAVCGYYAVLLAVIWRGRLRSTAAPLRLLVRYLNWLSVNAYRLPKKRTAGVLVVCVSLIWVAVLALPDTKLKVSFLDVGQGDAILITSPSGQQILIDGGPNPDTVCQQLGKKLPFWDKSLDMVVLTHSDDDHLVGLMGVLQDYKVGQVLESGYGEGPVYPEWLTEIEEREIDWTIARVGQQIDLGEGIVLEVIYPYDDLLEGTESEANSNSVCCGWCGTKSVFCSLATPMTRPNRICYTEAWFVICTAPFSSWVTMAAGIRRLRVPGGGRSAGRGHFRWRRQHVRPSQRRDAEQIGWCGRVPYG